MNMTNISEEEHEQNILDLYKLLGGAKQVANQLDISILDVYLTLKKYKLSIQERIDSETDRSGVLGAEGESEFLKLVPFATEVNAIINNNPAFDFLVGDITIDIKASRIIKMGRAKLKKEQWYFLLQRHYQKKYGADFYVLFACFGERLKDGYDVYIIPSELLAGIKSVNIPAKSKKSCMWHDFIVEPNKVSEFFQKLKDSQTPNYPKKKTAFHQVEITELDRLAKKVKKEVCHAE